MMNNTEADVRTDTLIRVMALFFVAIIVLAVTTNPIPSGTGVGERAPPLEGKAYNGSAWVDFDMESYLTANWTAGDAEGQWLLVEFMDTSNPLANILSIASLARGISPAHPRSPPVYSMLASWQPVTSTTISAMRRTEAVSWLPRL